MIGNLLRWIWRMAIPPSLGQVDWCVDAPVALHEWTTPTAVAVYEITVTVEVLSCG